MGTIQHLQRERGTVVLVGTTKGAFLVSADGEEIAGPYHQGNSIYALALDTRGRRRLLAATSSSHWGSIVSLSDDLGRSWSDPESAPIRFPEGSGVALAQVWQLVPGPADQPDVVYAGVEPAALFVSRDAGATWELNRGLFDVPERPKWQPGGGGLCLHTVLVRGRRLMVAISTAGVYRSDDGGETWRPRNAGIRAGFMPPGQQYPEFGQCVHKVVADPADEQRYFLQHHGGVYRSDDGGDSWQDISAGLPSDFGFPIVMAGDAVYVLPLESDRFRVTPEARLRVYRTRDRGASWTALAGGLPQAGAYETILRDGMATDARGGVYFGTRSGKLYGSPDGESWRLLREGLPPVVCVKTAQLD